MAYGAYFPETALVDCDGIPATVVAVGNGEPLVILVSEGTLLAFNEVKAKLGLAHVALANQLRSRICGEGGEFCEQSIAFVVQAMLKKFTTAKAATSRWP